MRMVRTYAAECATTNVRANLFAPGPTRTRMYASAFPRHRSRDTADTGKSREGDRTPLPAGVPREREAL